MNMFFPPHYANPSNRNVFYQILAKEFPLPWKDPITALFWNYKTNISVFVSVNRKHFYDVTDCNLSSP